jgi:hypothetical protein
VGLTPPDTEKTLANPPRDARGVLCAATTQRIVLGMVKRKTYPRWAARRATGGTGAHARARTRAAPLGLARRLHAVVESLGNNQTADLIGVSRSQPSRWRAGLEGIGPDNERRILDLEYVLARLGRLFRPEQARIWLESHNAHLGARPIDVLKLRGAEAVIAAVDAEEQGAYA